MTEKYLDASLIRQFLSEIGYRFRGAGSLYLYGFAGLVLAGQRPWATEITYCVELGSEDLPVFERVVNQVALELGIRHYCEHPGEVIPLPQGYQQRVLAIADIPLAVPRFIQQGMAHLSYYHFDPYSVAFRFLARGDEQDYELVLALLETGWVNFQEMENHLKALLPRFNCRTIQQDPAEFRRKYRGLCQMWRARQMGLPVNF